MRNLRNNAAHSRRVGPRNRLIQLGDAKTSNDIFLLFRVSDRASIILDRNRSTVFLLCFLCHLSIFDFDLRFSISQLVVSKLAIANRKSKIAN